MVYKEFFRENIYFFVILLIGLGISVGKYDWQANYNASKASFFLSFYLYLIFSFCLYFGVKTFFEIKTAVLTLLPFSIIFNFPIHFFNLDNFRYFKDRPLYFCDRLNRVIGCEKQRNENNLLDRQEINWFPDFNNLFPNEIIFFIILLFIGIYLINITIKKNQFKKYFIIFYLVIVAQTFLHNSLWSPITYITYFFSSDQLIRDAHTWFGFLFPDGSGAVNADYISVHNLQSLFNGVSIEASQSVRRSFIIYIASQFTYFVNPKYIYLIINIFAWFVSSCAMFYLVKKLLGKEYAILSAFLVSTGTGFIFVVGQPAPHVVGYGLYILIPFFIEKTFIEKQSITYNEILFSVSFLTLAFLVYDVLTLLIGSIAYCYFRKGNTKIYLQTVFSSIFFFYFYQFIAFDFLKLDNYENTANIKQAFITLTTYFLDFNFEYFYFNLIWTFTYIFNNISILFFIFIPTLMLFGMVMYSPKSIYDCFSIISLGLPALLIVIFFTMGRSGLETMPRFAYGFFPFVYIFASIAIFKFSQFFRKEKLKKIFISIILILNLIINNFDIFGYPAMYYHFYYGSGNYINNQIMKSQ